jgi:type I restriction enzyme M protein
MSLAAEDLKWYKDQIGRIDPKGRIVRVAPQENLVIYSHRIATDESRQREITPEELVHALAICLLTTDKYGYDLARMYHEKHYAHGSKGSHSDEVDLLLLDSENLPFALWEFKSAADYNSEKEDAIKRQLFGTAPLVGAPKLLVCATIKPEHPSVPI